MGVVFIEFIDKAEFDKNIHARVRFLYEKVDYSSLSVGTDFEVREGKHVVGKGTVLELYKY